MTPRQSPRLEEQIKIVRALLALRRAGRIPAIWVEQGRISVDMGYGTQQRITWQQAARLAAGEPFDQVCPADLPVPKPLARRPVPIRRAGNGRRVA